VRSGGLQPSSALRNGPDLGQLRAFRDQIRSLPPAWREEPRYLPYAIAFGLGPQWARH
jgi:hypothetical protein